MFQGENEQGRQKGREVEKQWENEKGQGQREVRQIRSGSGRRRRREMELWSLLAG